MLMQSGVMYSSDTIEFRLLLIHNIRKQAYRYYSTQWAFSRMLDLIHVAGMETVEKNSASQYQKTVTEASKFILDFINPFKKLEEDKKLKNTQDDLKKRELLDLLDGENPDGFSSLADLRASLKKVKQALASEEK